MSSHSKIIVAFAKTPNNMLAFAVAAHLEPDGLLVNALLTVIGNARITFFEIRSADKNAEKSIRRMRRLDRYREAWQMGQDLSTTTSCVMNSRGRIPSHVKALTFP